MADYDVITIGGGLGGAALARAMALHGVRVLVIEQETRFRDRVRGEGLISWGVAEARALGVVDLLLSSCAHRIPLWSSRPKGAPVMERPLGETTASGEPILTFYHPAMQEALLQAAADAGAEVRRGARARGVRPGAPATVTIENGSGTHELSARLVVGADGRKSAVRGWAGFPLREDPDSLRVSGLLLKEMYGAGEDIAHLVFHPAIGHQAITFPQGGGRVRAYVMTRSEEGIRLQGEGDFGRFRELAVDSGLPAEFFEGAKPAGPLATFEGAAAWVEQPYRDGIALLGDAAARSDPSWGQGLSLTLRGARVLRDALRDDEDWDAAGKRYAADQSAAFARIHEIESLFEHLFMTRGPDADAKRARALPLIAEDPTVLPDHLFGGPTLPVEGPIAELYGLAP